EDANKGNFPDGTTVTVGPDGTTKVTYPDHSAATIKGDQLVQGQKGDTTDAGNITPTVPGDKVTVKDPSHLTDDYTYDDYAYNDFYQVIIKANAVEVYTLPKGNLTKEKKLVHDTILTVLETKKIDGQVWYRIGTNRWIMAATTIKVGELENF
ncbi:SLAP domain-containing protein, partial [Lactobacillus kitasatonis]